MSEQAGLGGTSRQAGGRVLVGTECWTLAPSLTVIERQVLQEADLQTRGNARDLLGSNL